ncbi:thiamine phosphate synthase [Candidatus Thioglobus sp. NP1]|jgi:thiamine-phosphate pyrophosphorylase|uniref:thiamine phosphate synthase n=1 Tax=Candidatus Thioglobus sp. NP1 TaxID=2508687 RepID=UPI000DED82F5|nr:thiamine phosphate synthase [Candidatus Thioglobus sp. NP1]AXE62711.1 thiamine phosphate synthase [Candidatus Thioglobus sp. NP1]
MLNQKIQGLYGITPNKDLNISLIKNVIKKHKVNILQYRHKTQDEKIKLEEAKYLLTLCKEHNTLFLVNDDINLCEKVGADGVHLGKNDIEISLARKQLGEKFIIGVSCYNNPERAIEAQDIGANYVAFGSIFNSKTKPSAPHCSLSIIENIKNEINIPIVGIGGITFENQKYAYAAGCDSVAMLEGLFNY